MASQLIFVRHGETADNAARRLVGSRDTGLNEVGRQQAERLRGIVLPLKPDACLCSPRRRAVQTAEPTATSLGLTVETDTDLREIDFGHWEGKTFAEISEEAPDAADAWGRGDAEFAFPGGDSMADFFARAMRMADSLAAHPADTLLIVSHCALINAMLYHLLGLPPNGYDLFTIKNATAAVVNMYDGKGILSALNLGLTFEE